MECLLSKYSSLIWFCHLITHKHKVFPLFITFLGGGSVVCNFWPYLSCKCRWWIWYSISTNRMDCSKKTAYYLYWWTSHWDLWKYVPHSCLFLLFICIITFGFIFKPFAFWSEISLLFKADSLIYFLYLHNFV